MGAITVNHESDTITRIKLKNKEIILVGTAHVSPESVEEVQSVIRDRSPDHVCVEIDEGRYKTLTSKNAWQNMDIQKVLKERKGFLLLANLVLSSFQKKVGLNVGSKPGEEMRQAVLTSQEQNIPFSFSDRPVQVTLQRAWRLSNFWNKMKLLSVLIGTAFSNEEVYEEDVEKLKKSNALQQMMEELSKFLPSIKQVLIDERDQYLATKIYEAEGSVVAAVIGAGHAPGIIRWLEDLETGEKDADLSEISVVPPRKFVSKLTPWIIPLLVIGIFVAGFFIKGFEGGIQMLVRWVLYNGTLAAIGSMIALAHPLTVLASFVTAPITSMNPTIGVGLVTGFMEYFLKKPKIRDLEHLQEESASFKGFYRNRVTHILLVLIMSSLGSVAGTLIWGLDNVDIFNGIYNLIINSL